MKLSEIKSPAEIKKLSISELEELAKEIRQVIISTVAKTGGHLAPNLGVVELTLALHYVFDSPRDKIIFDVGHQCYAHKLLTGRYNRFHTLRRFGGISGYPQREESEHDIFNTGHASTAISAALGIACARDLKKEKFHVIAVVGDGAMTGGLAYEALNNAGHLRKDLIVVLNDNEMSISRNVGGIASYLNRIITDRRYNLLQQRLTTFTEKIPIIGSKMIFLKRGIEKFIKGLFTSGVFFEELGFRYFGPVDGHNLATLIDIFSKVKEFSGPVLIHVVTKKGKGYPPAELNPEKWHGTAPFPIDNHDMMAEEIITYSDIFGETIVKLAKEDKRIIAITAAMAPGTGLKKFAQTFPERFFDVGIAEEHAVTFAAGLACEGFKPVVAIYSTFLQRAYDQIVHDVCLQNLPVIFAIDRAGIVAGDGYTHQGVLDLSYLRSIPNMTILAPKDEFELEQMLAFAINYNGPIAIRYPRDKIYGVKPPTSPSPIKKGKAEILRSGKDLAILAVGSMVYPSLEAAELLEKENISATVVNMRFVKPLDEELIINLATQMQLIVTVEENVFSGGFGAGVLECLTQHKISDTNILLIGIPDTFPEHGDRYLLLEKFGLTAPAIYKKIFAYLQEKNVVHKFNDY